MPCLTPIQIKNKKTGGDVVVPCYRCKYCKQKRASQWGFRLMQEEKVSSSAYFITLTLDTNNVDISAKGFMTLNKKRWQLFMKRLRKAHKYKKGTVRPIKYYAVGEYGTYNWRPHYHAIIFNADIEKIAKAWINVDTNEMLGEIYYGNVTTASVGYTLKYLCKDKRVPRHNNDDRLTEFSLMSTKLGADYLNPKQICWHKQCPEERMYVNYNGFKISMPRYYKLKMYSDDERLTISKITLNRMHEELQRKIAKRKPHYWNRKQERIYQNSQSLKEKDRSRRL